MTATRAKALFDHQRELANMIALRVRQMFDAHQGRIETLSARLERLEKILDREERRSAAA